MTSNTTRGTGADPQEQPDAGTTAASASCSGAHARVVDAAVAQVAAHKERWAALPAADKLALLQRVREQADGHADEWATEQARWRGYTGEEHGPGMPAGDNEELAPALWHLGPGMFGMCVNSLLASYEHLVRNSCFPPPMAVRHRPDGQVIAAVFPATALDKAFAPGFRGEVWLAPGEDAPRQPLPGCRPAVCAVLGAGNYDAPVEMLGKLFVDGHAVVYKPNPVNQANAAMLRRILAPLIEEGCLAIVEGGAAVGRRLLAHPAVDDVLMTGNAATYNRIVWGDGPQREQRALDKPVEAELGGVSPVLVVPGRWSARDLDHHARQIVAAKLSNSGHTCASPQVILTDAAWPQREAFLQRLRAHLTRPHGLRHFYPGADERCARFAALPGAETLAPGGRPPVWLRDLPLHSPLLTEEAFGLVLGELAVRGTDGDAARFLARATAICDEHLAGTLAATLLMDSATAAELGKRRLDDAVAALRYGCIGVNLWGGALLFFAGLPWGAYPGHTPADIQSGVGKINNTRGYAAVQKSVMWTPFRSLLHPQPLRRRDRVAIPRLGRYALRPNSWRLAKLASGAVLGV